MAWTRFWDMSSGGGQKEDFNLLFIEAPLEEAKSVFYARFGHNPERVSCTCCGPDYSISEDADLAQATGYYRNCAFENGKYVEKPETRYRQGTKLIPLDKYLKQKDVKVIYASEIEDHERTMDVPGQGYVWRA